MAQILTLLRGGDRCQGVRDIPWHRVDQERREDGHQEEHQQELGALAGGPLARDYLSGPVNARWRRLFVTS